jgi:DNA-binding NarL/FixJ family response regulator
MNRKTMNDIRVLIVDDMAQVRQDLRTVLPLFGEIEIVGEAADGREAAAQAMALRPDVVLMDLEMPVLDGYESTRRIKAQCPGIRVIALTLHGYAAARDRAARAGTDDFIEKGAPLQALVQSIQRCAETSNHTGDRQ